jgi:Zn-dependent protease with chaperone function
MEAFGRRHAAVCAGHLLLALTDLAQPESAAAVATDRADQAADLWRDLHVDLGGLRFRAAAHVNADAAGEGFPFLGASLGTSAALPGRARRCLRAGTVIAFYVALAAAVVAAAHPGARPSVMAVAFAVPAAAFLVHRLTWPAAVQRQLSGSDVEDLPVNVFRGMLAGTGMRRVTVACAPGGRAAGRSLRAAAWGALILRSDLKDAQPDLARFIALHEAGHLVRDDSLTRTLALVGLLGVAGAAPLASIAGWLAVLPALAGFIAWNWHCEFACDRLAAGAAGQVPTRQFIAYLGRVDARRRRDPAQSAWAVRAAIAHPPARMRASALQRALPQLDPRPGKTPVPGLAAGHATEGPSVTR